MFLGEMFLYHMARLYRQGCTMLQKCLATVKPVRSRGMLSNVSRNAIFQHWHIGFCVWICTMCEHIAAIQMANVYQRNRYILAIVYPLNLEILSGLHSPLAIQIHARN